MMRLKIRVRRKIRLMLEYVLRRRRIVLIYKYSIHTHAHTHPNWVGIWRVLVKKTLGLLLVFLLFPHKFLSLFLTIAIFTKFTFDNLFLDS